MCINHSSDGVQGCAGAQAPDWATSVPHAPHPARWLFSMLSVTHKLIRFLLQLVRIDLVAAGLPAQLGNWKTSKYRQTFFLWAIASVSATPAAP